MLDLRKGLLASTIVAGFAFGVAGAASAQDAAPAEQGTASGEIIVTGSRIANPNLEAASQILVVDAEEISFQNVNTAEELLRQLPGAVPSIGPAVNNGNGGAQTIDLRGIGANRNLVLLDSRRIVPFGLTGVTDLNHIPIALIERVDVVTGGASSVYGADAISGLTNFITRRDFQGVELTTSYRETEQRDGESRRAELLIGSNVDGGKGNVVFSVGYQDTKPVLQGDREFSEFNISSVTGNPGGSSATAPTVVVAPGLFGQFNPTTGAISPGFTPFNFNPLNLFQTPVERFNIYTKAHYEILPNVEIYGDAFFTRSNVRTQIAPSATFFNTYQLPISNPFLPTPARNQICAAFSITQAACDAAAATTDPNDPAYREVSLGLRRRFVEAGPRTTDFQTDAFQIAGGFRGDLPVGWTWDFSAQYGESDLTSTIGGFGLFSRAQQALRAVDQNTCIDPSNGCVPLNLFGPIGSLTSEQFNFLDAASTTFTNTQLTAVNLTFAGDTGAFKSPFAAEPIGLAFGAEYRDYQADSAGDFLGQQPGELLGAGGADPSIVGGYDVREVFIESLLPLISDQPLVQALTLEAGFRYSDYSSTGTGATWKVGGTWEVNDQVQFRSVFQVAERAPNIDELFSPVQTVLDNFATDPCAGAAPVGNPALQAVCLSQGAPASSIGIINDPAAGQVNITTGGNPNLDVEEAETLTVGVILRPAFVQNLTVTFDYFDIEVMGAITSPEVGDIIDGCFDPAFNPSLAINALCGLIVRNSIDGSLNGSPADVQGIILQTSNLGLINTSGFDFGINYDRDLGGLGALDYSFAGTYTRENRFQATPTSVDRDCVGFFSTNCGNIQPELQLNQRITWSIDRYDLSLQHRYLSGVEIEPAVAGDFLPQFESIDAFNYFDLTLRAALTERFELTATVDNLTDKEPPIVGADVGPTAFNSGNTYPTVYDALGRTYTIAGRLRF